MEKQTMQWHELLQCAEQCEEAAQKQLDLAEGYLIKAIEHAQSTLGPYDVNLAKCFLAHAHYLEMRQRFSEALLRYKLAASIYKQGGQGSAHALAASKVARMKTLLGLEDE